MSGAKVVVAWSLGLFAAGSWAGAKMIKKIVLAQENADQNMKSLEVGETPKSLKESRELQIKRIQQMTKRTKPVAEGVPDQEVIKLAFKAFFYGGVWAIVGCGVLIGSVVFLNNIKTLEDFEEVMRVKVIRRIERGLRNFIPEKPIKEGQNFEDIDDAEFKSLLIQLNEDPKNDPKK
eukprot:c3813_g1_i1.p1 GENE.c3813_g1_i1~~c3813_g1_i1.p1  ORF type:complete len:177 (-),score=60.14 c3813_g1_i1:14-544(-)